MAFTSASSMAPIGTQIHFGFVGTGFAAGHPEDEDGLAIDFVGRRERVIIGLDRRIA